jgi:hypothetical protein
VSGWTDTLAPAATLCAAVITGIAAASLRHRWVVAADVQRKRWDEADQRKRDGLDALTAYLAARPTLAALSAQRHLARPGTRIDLDGVLAPFRLAYARAVIVLADDAEREVIDADYAAVDDWLRASARHIDSQPPTATAPVATEVNELARWIAARSIVGNRRGRE